MKKIFFLASVLMCFIPVQVFSKEQGLISLQEPMMDRMVIACKTQTDSVSTFQSIYFANVIAERKEEGIRIAWVVESIKSSNYFVIERSQDGKNFEPIGSLKVKKNAACYKLQYLDDQPLPGTNFYRVKQMNFEKGHSYSEIIPFEY